MQPLCWNRYFFSFKNSPYGNKANFLCKMGRDMREVSLDICGQPRPRLACVSVQSDQELHCPLTELLDTTKCMNVEQMPRWYFTHAQNDLNLRKWRMFKCTYSLDAAHMMSLYWKFFSLRICVMCVMRDTYMIPTSCSSCLCRGKSVTRSKWWWQLVHIVDCQGKTLCPSSSSGCTVRSTENGG